MNFDRFLDIARRARPFLSSGGRAFATVPAQPPGCLSLPLRSRAFRQWFYDQCYSAFDTIPSAQTFAAILHHLDAQAARDPQTCNIRVPFRVGSSSPTELLLDLANPSGEFVEITPTGWRIRSGPDFPFQTSPATISLPTPEPPVAGRDPLDSLRATLNLGPPDGPAWLRTLAWLLASVRPPGPYPILVLRGPANSGKSFAGLVLRTLIDPSACPYSPLPATVREILTFARQNWVLAFDHVQALTPTVAAALCRLASGAGLPCREPGQAEPLQLWTRRPILLTAAPGWVAPPDLAARALTVDLPPLPPPFAPIPNSPPPSNWRYPNSSEPSARCRLPIPHRLAAEPPGPRRFHHPPCRCSRLCPGSLPQPGQRVPRRSLHPRAPRSARRFHPRRPHPHPALDRDRRRTDQIGPSRLHPEPPFQKTPRVD